MKEHKQKMNKIIDEYVKENSPCKDCKAKNGGKCPRDYGSEINGM